MRKLLTTACAAAVGIPLSAAYAASAAASTTIVVGPGQSIQAAINHARPGATILVRPGVYHQSLVIRKNGITLRGSGDFRGGTVLEPPKTFPKTPCNAGFGPTGVCVLAKKVNLKTGAVSVPVRNVTVTAMVVSGFPGNGVFGYGTAGLRVTRVVASNNGGYGISRFESTRTLFANDTATGSDEAGFYVGDSPRADTVIRNNQAYGNALGIFIRHARHIWVSGNRVWGNCQGILVLDDGQPGGVGNTAVLGNSVFRNNKFCPKSEEAPPLKGGGILLLGATRSVVALNSVAGNAGRQFNSGGIVVASAKPLSGGAGSNPRFDAIIANTAYRDHPADLIWDGSGSHIKVRANHCRTSVPAGFCH
jgi:Right handed beta helix region